MLKTSLGYIHSKILPQKTKTLDGALFVPWMSSEELENSSSFPSLRVPGGGYTGCEEPLLSLQHPRILYYSIPSLVKAFVSQKPAPMVPKS
jgi:hypothetical protein